MDRQLEALDRLKAYADSCEGDYWSYPGEDYKLVKNALEAYDVLLKEGHFHVYHAGRPGRDKEDFYLRGWKFETHITEEQAHILVNAGLEIFANDNILESFGIKVTKHEYK